MNGVATLIDFHKAFVSISHATLFHAMSHFGFTDKFINLIKEMFRVSTDRVLVNGLTTYPLKIMRGTKQGDPISPSLFVIVIELLNAAFQDDNVIQASASIIDTLLRSSFLLNVILLSLCRKSVQFYHK